MSNKPDRIYKCSRCGRYPISRLEKHASDTLIIIKCNCRIHKYNVKDFTPGDALRAWNAQQKE